ncbi:MAG: hypothetical protein GX235_08960 [Clostridiales bacterium]|nr:hypothetical protein [Clostridiales bacterium]
MITGMMNPYQQLDNRTVTILHRKALIFGWALFYYIYIDSNKNCRLVHAIVVFDTTYITFNQTLLSRWNSRRTI